MQGASLLWIILRNIGKNDREVSETFQVGSHFYTSKDARKSLPANWVDFISAVTVAFRGTVGTKAARVSCTPTSSLKTTSHAPIPPPGGACHGACCDMCPDPGHRKGPSREAQAVSKTLLGRKPQPHLATLFTLSGSYLLDQETFLVAIIFPTVSYPNSRHFLLQRVLKSIYVRHQG